MSHLQIQPLCREGAAWQAFAEQENLHYEVLELSAPPALNDETAYRFAMDWYRSSGRTTALHGAFMDVNVGSGDEKIRRISEERCRESCRQAMALGAEYVVFHTSAEPFLRGGYLDRWSGQCADFFLSLVEEFPLTLCIENSADLDSDAIGMLLQRTRSPRIGACLDIGHAHYSPAGVARWFDALGDDIRYLHLSDNGGRFDDHLPLGEGMVDWAQAHTLWQQLRRDTPITLETGGLEQVRRSLDYLRRFGLFGEAVAHDQ